MQSSFEAQNLCWISKRRINGIKLNLASSRIVTNLRRLLATQKAQKPFTGFLWATYNVAAINLVVSTSENIQTKNVLFAQ